MWRIVTCSKSTSRVANDHLSCLCNFDDQLILKVNTQLLKGSTSALSALDLLSCLLSMKPPNLKSSYWLMMNDLTIELGMNRYEQLTSLYITTRFPKLFCCERLLQSCC